MIYEMYQIISPFVFWFGIAMFSFVGAFAHYHATKAFLNRFGCRIFGHKPHSQIVEKHVIWARCTRCRNVLIMANRQLHNDKWYVAEKRFQK